MHPRGPRTEDVDDWARAAARQGQRRKDALGCVEVLKRKRVVSEIVCVWHELQHILRGDAFKLKAGSLKSVLDGRSARRFEEIGRAHSELQSLMRISYAV